MKLKKRACNWKENPLNTANEGGGEGRKSEKSRQKVYVGARTKNKTLRFDKKSALKEKRKKNETGNRERVVRGWGGLPLVLMKKCCARREFS